jgi:hypothetical protein
MKTKQKSYVKPEPKSQDHYSKRTAGEMIKTIKEIEFRLSGNPHQIDHSKFELNPGCFIIYVICFQTFFEVVKEGRILKNIKHLQGQIAGVYYLVHRSIISLTPS